MDYKNRLENCCLYEKQPSLIAIVATAFAGVFLVWAAFILLFCM